MGGNPPGAKCPPSLHSALMTQQKRQTLTSFPFLFGSWETLVLGGEEWLSATCSPHEPLLAGVGQNRLFAQASGSCTKCLLRPLGSARKEAAGAQDLRSCLPAPALRGAASSSPPSPPLSSHVCTVYPLNSPVFNSKRYSWSSHCM